MAVKSSVPRLRVHLRRGCLYDRSARESPTQHEARQSVLSVLQLASRSQQQRRLSTLSRWSGGQAASPSRLPRRTRAARAGLARAANGVRRPVPRPRREISDGPTRMLLLFETPAGFALFKANEKKLAKVENVFEEFATAEKARDLCVERPQAALEQCGRCAAGARVRVWLTRSVRLCFARAMARTLCQRGPASMRECVHAEVAATITRTLHSRDTAAVSSSRRFTSSRTRARCERARAMRHTTTTAGGGRDG